MWKQAATAFTVIAVISFLLTVELRRWTWAIAFALGWGAVIALIGWFTAQYNQVGEIFEFPFLSGILAVLIAAPLFQTIRDEGAWRFPYARLHRHAWTDAVIGAASLFFTGITFLLAWLIASLFDVIGIDAIKDLLQEEWFGWMLAGFAFGGAHRDPARTRRAGRDAAEAGDGRAGGAGAGAGGGAGGLPAVAALHRPQAACGNRTFRRPRCCCCRAPARSCWSMP